MRERYPPPHRCSAMKRDAGWPGRVWDKKDQVGYTCESEKKNTLLYMPCFMIELNIWKNMSCQTKMKPKEAERVCRLGLVFHSISSFQSPIYYVQHGDWYKLFIRQGPCQNMRYLLFLLGLIRILKSFTSLWLANCRLFWHLLWWTLLCGSFLNKWNS